MCQSRSVFLFGIRYMNSFECHCVCTLGLNAFIKQLLLYFQQCKSFASMEGNHSSSTGSPQPSVPQQTDGHIYEVAVQSNATNRSSQFADVALLQTFKPLIIPCYVLVVVVGVFGNYLLLYVICRTRKMHNVTNFFIGNLAFSDMLMCVTCVPFTLAYAFNPHGWVFGRSMCYLVFLIQPVTVYVSVFTLTAIAVDRWVDHLYFSSIHSNFSICVTPYERKRKDKQHTYLRLTYTHHHTCLLVHSQ